MARRISVIPMSDTADAITPGDVSPTALPDAFLSSDLAASARGFSLPRYRDIPDMPLYRDQVTTYIGGIFEALDACGEGPWITPSMVNNYVKAGLVPSPLRKQYTREHVARLIVVCAFKQFLPMDAIRHLFEIQRMTYPVAMSYDYVATELENRLREAFSQDLRIPDSASHVTRESLLVRGAASAFAAKAYLMSYLAFSGLEQH